MKKIEVFMLPTCPHCIKFMKAFNELDLSGLDVDIIDESSDVEKASKYDYYYVPTVFIDGKKVHEGVVLEDTIENIKNLIK